MNLLYIYRLDLDNPGDAWSCPGLYLGKNWRGSYRDVYSGTMSGEFDLVVIGGGSVLNNSKMIFEIQSQLNQINFKHLVVWGAGVDLDLAKPVIDRATIVGSRDWVADHEKITWVPCVSCKHSLFDHYRKISADKDFLIVDHWKRKPIHFPSESITYQRMQNKPATMQSVLDAISQHRYVITSSYHAAYWSILLGRKTVIISSPWQPKLEGFKWLVPSGTFMTWQMLDEATAWTDALHEARDSNDRFTDRISDLICSNP